jgi:hypothetical protein
MFTPEINKVVTEAFRSIVKYKDSDVFKNSKSINNLIRDFLPGYEYESVRNMIRFASEMNIFAFLLDESIPKTNRAEYAAKMMCEKGGY